MVKYKQTKIIKNLELRAKIVSIIRSFFEDRKFIEVETPIRIPAPAPEINIVAQDSGNWFLHTSPELCMKRLVAAGYSKIFQICKCFRKHERGDFHLPEMTILEWYETGLDYKDMMVQCETLMQHIAKNLDCYNKGIYYQGQKINFSDAWVKISIAEAFNMYASIDIKSAISRNKFEEVLCLEIEPKLKDKGFVFLYDYPSVLGSLAKISPINSSLAERFELYCAGVELCNAFSELRDPIEQRSRFEFEIEQRKRNKMQIYPMPELFLDALNDLPMVSGSAMGIDRLVMLFTGAKKIDQVVSFTPEEL